MTAFEPILTNLMLAREHFAKDSRTEFHENMEEVQLLTLSDGGTDGRTDGHGLHIRLSFFFFT